MSFALLISQRADAAGNPAPAEFRSPIVGTVAFPEHAVAINELVKLGARWSNRVGSYDYTDPQRGSGSVALEGFAVDDVVRVDDHFRVEQARQQLGLSRASSQWLDTNTWATVARSARNPIFMIVFGAIGVLFSLVLGVLSSVGPMRVTGQSFTWYYLPVVAILLALFLAIVVQHSRRLYGWRRLRDEFVRRGEQMPTNLRIFQ